MGSIPRSGGESHILWFREKKNIAVSQQKELIDNVSLSTDNWMKTILVCGLNKGNILKFPEAYCIQQTPEEGQLVKCQKHYGYKNEDVYLIQMDFWSLISSLKNLHREVLVIKYNFERLTEKIKIMCS